MPPSTVGSRGLDDRVWSVAARSAPVVIQFVIAVLLIATWLLGRLPIIVDTGTDAPFTAVLIATGITVLIALIVAATLLRRGSSTARGVGLSTAASAAIALIGAIPYAFWLL